MPKTELTEKLKCCKKTLLFIYACLTIYKHSPTDQEIGNLIEISSGKYIIKSLQEKGWVNIKNKNSPRREITINFPNIQRSGNIELINAIRTLKAEIDDSQSENTITNVGIHKDLDKRLRARLDQAPGPLGKCYPHEIALLFIYACGRKHYSPTDDEITRISCSGKGKEHIRHLKARRGWISVEGIRKRRKPNEAETGRGPFEDVEKVF